MAKKKAATTSTYFDLSALNAMEDRGFAQAAAQGGMANIPQGTTVAIPTPDVKANVGTTAPGTRPQQINFEDRGFTEAAATSGQPFVPATGDALGSIVERVDRYGRTVRIYSTGPQAGTIVGSGGILYEPPQEDVGTPAATSTRSPGGIAGATVTVGEGATGTVTVTPRVYDNPAYKIAEKTLEQYGLTGIASALAKVRADFPELGLDDILFMVENDEKYNAPFKARFKANEIRTSKKLAKLSAADYLAMEQGFNKLFTRYNLPILNTQSYYDKLIGNDVDMEDATDRVVRAYDLLLSRPSNRQAFSQFFGALTDSDIVSALLSEEVLPILEKKITAARIGGAALRQGLSTSLAPVEAEVTPEGRQVTGFTNVRRGTIGADTLAGLDITEEQAQAGYQRIAEYLPEAEKLSAIYGGRAEQYTRQEAEQAEILGLESARRKARKLIQLEEEQFSGGPGTGSTSLKKRTRGQY